MFIKNFNQKQTFRKLLILINNNANNSAYPYKVWGIFGSIAYIFYYLIWIFANPQGYENLAMRIIASILCIPLIFYEKWPRILKPYLPLYWYITILYCLPFFFTFMLLKNNFSQPETLNILAALVLFILLLDTASMIILLIIGSFFGYVVFRLTTPTFNFNADYPSIIISYLSVIVVGALFSHKREQIQQEKLQTIKAIGASIAHELRTPLRTIISAAHGIKKYFPPLLEGYQLAKKEKLPVEYINPAVLEVLLTACDDIESEADAAFTVINMLLVNVTQSVNTRELKTISIEHCVDETLRRYPFDLDEAQLVHWNHENSFLFQGNELLIIHVLFNLLKNALYQIKATGKGEIFIWFEHKDKFNLLHFKDTAKGMSRKTLSHLFDRFFTQTYHGTGIGLAFCRIVMENLGGKIECKSSEGEYAEFILYFPTDPKSKRIRKIRRSGKKI